jgi:glycosyltransferase involved in cell wall biosynthesis
MHVLLLTTAYKNKFNPVNALFFYDQAKALLNNGCKVGVICPMPITFTNILKSKRFVFSDEFYDDDRIITYVRPFLSIPKLKKRTANIRLDEGIVLFKKYIKENGTPDIIHVHIFLAGEIALWIKEKYNIPFVVTEHSTGFTRGIYNQRQLQVAKKVFTNSECNIAVSEPFCSLLEDKTKEHFKYIPNVVDTNFFTLPLKKSNTKKFTFLNVGHLDKKKNQLGLIKAFKKSFFGQNSYQLKIVGDGSERKNLADFVRDEKLELQVHIVGKKNRNEVKFEMQQADCFVLSSYHETFGVVLIEAMSCGLPVLSTKSGGPESIIKSSKLGTLCDLKDLDKEMLKIVKSNYNSDYIRKYIVNNFSEKIISKQLIKVYNNVNKK